MRKAAIGAGVLALLCFAQSGAHSGAQSQIGSQYPYSATLSGNSDNLNDPKGEADRAAAQKSLKRLNDERQRQITQDGLKLLRLATELKSQVDLVGRSADAVREAEQIARLAHGIREKMIEDYRR